MPAIKAGQSRLCSVYVPVKPALRGWVIADRVATLSRLAGGLKGAARISRGDWARTA